MSGNISELCFKAVEFILSGGDDISLLHHTNDNELKLLSFNP
jgi:hypothetical protein